MRSRTVVTGAVIGLLGALVGCAPVMQLVSAEAAEHDGGILVSGDWLVERLDDPSVVVLHVAREEEHFRSAHLPHARFVRLGEIVTEREGIPNLLPEAAVLRGVFERVGVSSDTHVVVYGDLDGLAASRAFFSLEYLGHPRVSLLNGGIEAWMEDGRRIASGAPSPVEQGRITSAVRPEIVVDAEQVRRMLDATEYALIDARPEAHFRGTEGGDEERFPRWGHLPGAGNVFWRETLLDGPRPLHRAEAELRAMFAEAGASPDRTVIAYCNTGVQASHAYLTARILGMDVKVYDGSFIDWSPRDPALYPVARIE